MSMSIKYDGKPSRKCLGVLQPNRQSRLSSANGNLKLHTSNKNDENFAPKSNRKDGIFEDPAHLKKKTFATASVQADVPPALTADTLSHSRKAASNDGESSALQAQRTIDMLTSDAAPSTYWEELAERRREALEVALEENQRLHEEKEALLLEITKLKEENKLLDVMVEEAKDLAVLVESLTCEAELSIQ